MRGKIRTRWAFLKHDVDRWMEHRLADLARKLPRSLRYWTFITVAADATTGDPFLLQAVVPEITLDELIRAVHHQLRGECRYPYLDGDVIVLGPEVFMARDGSVLSYRGENYVPQAAPVEQS